MAGEGGGKMSEEKTFKYSAIQRASEMADKRCDFLRFVIYLTEDKLDGNMTKEENLNPKTPSVENNTQKARYNKGTLPLLIHRAYAHPTKR